MGLNTPEENALDMMLDDIEVRRVEALESIAKELAELTRLLGSYGRGGRNAFLVQVVGH